MLGFSDPMLLVQLASLKKYVEDKLAAKAAKCEKDEQDKKQQVEKQLQDGKEKAAQLKGKTRKVTARAQESKLQELEFAQNHHKRHKKCD